MMNSRTSITLWEAGLWPQYQSWQREMLRILFEEAEAHGNPVGRPHDTYEEMQQRVGRGYAILAGETGAQIAPVGLAWARVHRKRPGFPLWAPDGSHASPAGSYLAACVFYRVLYGKPALGNAYTAGLSEADARLLQRAADEARGR